jgi:hypothetical protein
MYLTPECEIYIQSRKTYLITKFQRIKITLSRSLPCDLAEITLPKLDSLKLFSEDDEVKIILANNLKKVVFAGYISELSPTDEPVIKCEDYSKILKQKRNKKSYFDTYDAIARDIIQFCGFTPVIPESFGQKRHFWWAFQTAWECLEELKKCGWDSYLIPATKKIYFGRPYNCPQINPKIYCYEFGKNIIKSNLEYRTQNPVNKVIVYVTDSKFRGSSIKVEEGTGEPVGIYNLQMEFDPENASSVNGAIGEAKKFARQKLSQSQTSGYTGSFTTFGNPEITHSMKLKIIDPEKQERTGHYYIDEVIHTFSPDDGYKMEITIGAREQGTIV